MLMLKYSLLSEASKYYENVCIKEALTICKNKYFRKNVVNPVSDFISNVYFCLVCCILQKYIT